jgi:REP-associated tyrosine transposase
MARPLRHIVPDLICRVLNRGNRRRPIFRKPQDDLAFIECLAQASERYRVELLARCLMPNPWHLVLRPRGERQLQEFMRWLTVTHVRRHQGHHCGVIRVGARRVR